MIHGPDGPSQNEDEAEEFVIEAKDVIADNEELVATIENFGVVKLGVIQVQVRVTKNALNCQHCVLTNAQKVLPAMYVIHNIWQFVKSAGLCLYHIAVFVSPTCAQQDLKCGKYVHI